MVVDENDKLRRRQRTNIIIARFIPAFLTAVVAYASYVFVGPLCVNYLINPPNGIPQRTNLGIALPIVFFFLLILMATCYFRLIYIVLFDPGYAPKGSDTYRHPSDSLDKAEAGAGYISHAGAMSAAVEKQTQDLIQLDYDGILRHGAPAPPGLDELWSKDAFVCDRNGLPLWCHSCGIWKHDRVHHSRDVGRCVYKMDHFCPWVGGMVGENGFKFFVQFNTYACIFSFYTMAVMAYFVAEAQRRSGTIGDIQWVVILGVGGFFGLFTFGLAFTSLQFTIQNLTTVENLDKGNRTMCIAVLLPPELQKGSDSFTTPSRAAGSEVPLRSEIDDPSHQSYFSSERSTRLRRDSGAELATSIWQGTITYPLDGTPGERRTFAILKTPPGLNPWNLGGTHNLISVFGTTLHSWLLPYARSPCTDHSNDVSMYPFGWEFEQLLTNARLTSDSDFIRDMMRGSTTTKNDRKKRRKLAEGWQNGERPDGWIPQKEARRVRREHRERDVLPP